MDEILDIVTLNPEDMEKLKFFSENEMIEEMCTLIKLFQIRFLLGLWDIV